MEKKFLNPTVKKIILLVVLLPLLALIWPFVQRPQKKAEQPVPIEQVLTEDANVYLEENLFEPNFNGKLFCAHKTLGAGESEKYIWALCEEYYLENGEAKAGTGRSLPLVLKMTDGKIASHVAPGDGTLYGEDVRKLFPENLHDTIFGFSASSEIEALTTEVQNKVQAHFITE